MTGADGPAAAAPTGRAGPRSRRILDDHAAVCHGLLELRSSTGEPGGSPARETGRRGGRPVRGRARRRLLPVGVRRRSGWSRGTRSSTTTRRRRATSLLAHALIRLGRIYAEPGSNERAEEALRLAVDHGALAPRLRPDALHARSLPVAAAGGGRGRARGRCRPRVRWPTLSATGFHPDVVYAFGDGADRRRDPPARGTRPRWRRRRLPTSASGSPAWRP